MIELVKALILALVLTLTIRFICNWIIDNLQEGNELNFNKYLELEGIKKELEELREENKKLKWKIETYEEYLKERYDYDFIFENKGYCYEDKRLKTYKTKLLNEYNELGKRIEELNNLLRKHTFNELDFELNCPKSLLLEQLEVMTKYYKCLVKRIKIEIEGEKQ